jgi:serine/threonine-protein kinase
MASLPAEGWLEAQLLTQLSGDFVLPVQTAEFAAGAPIIVTDLAHNGTLAMRIPADRGVPWPQAVRWARQMNAGLMRVHSSGLVHRDLKPENLFLSDADAVLLGDFGLAGLLNPSGAALVAGTLSTMAPEVAAVFAARDGGAALDQADASKYTVQADVFSAGATLYWMLGGASPLAAAHTYANAASLRVPDAWDIAPQVPRWLRDAANRALAFEAKDRFATVAEFDRAIGGRPRPRRVWSQRDPHPTHLTCFEGRSSGPTIDVCVIPDPRPSWARIDARYTVSGRSIGGAGGETPRRNVPAKLRATFATCDQRR